jgi:hypothetical protein
VKFMIKCFEANYPECLGAVLVHKAPWIFQGKYFPNSASGNPPLTQARHLEGDPRLARPRRRQQGSLHQQR